MRSVNQAIEIAVLNADYLARKIEQEPISYEELRGGTKVVWEEGNREEAHLIYSYHG